MSSTAIAPVQAQLLAEYQRRNAGIARLTMSALLKASGLPLTRSTLHRKLHGTLTLTLDEAQAIARALGVQVTVSVKRPATKRAA